MPTPHHFDYGVATAYGAAKEQGYTGTYEEFKNAMIAVLTSVNYVTEKAAKTGQDAEQTHEDKLATAADRKAVSDDKADVAGYKSDVEGYKEDAAESKRLSGLDAEATAADRQAVSTMKDWVSTNTQLVNFYIDPYGNLVEERVGADIFRFALDAYGNLIISDAHDNQAILSLGPVTAYAYAQEAGYQGTEADFKEALATTFLTWDQAKIWTQGTPAQVAALGGIKSAKDYVEEAKTIRDEVITFVRQPYVYGIVTDKVVQKTDALNASYRVVYDNMTHELVRVDNFTQEPCHNWRRLLLTWEDEHQVHTYLNPSDSRYLAAGGTADLTGGHGDVMVKLPGVYRRNYDYTDSVLDHPMEVMLYATDPFLDCEPDPGTLVDSANGKPRDQLVGAFMGCHCDSTGAIKTNSRYTTTPTYANTDKLRSIIGARPCVNLSGYNMRTMAHNNKLQLVNWQTLRLIADLVAVHFGTYNIQDGWSKGFNFMDAYDRFWYYRKSGRSVPFGNGTGELYAQMTTLSTITVSSVVFSRYAAGDVFSNANGYARAWKDENNNVVYTPGWESTVGDTVYSDGLATTSAGTISEFVAGDIDDDLVGHWGSAMANVDNKCVVNCFQGMEYPWGAGCYILGDGGIHYRKAVSQNACIVYSCLDSSKYHTSFSYPTIPAGYTAQEFNQPYANQYISVYDPKTKLPIVPAVAGDNFTGGDNKSLSDYWYMANSVGERAIRRGGPLAYGAYAGPFYVAVIDAFSRAGVSYGCRAALASE